MKLTRIKKSNYGYGDWRVLRMESGSWIVWNTQTQTRTARDCPNTRWFVNLPDAKRFLLETAP
jgi:hypothetical protein